MRLDDGTIVGDPMERTTLDALNWQLSKGDQVTPVEPSAPHRTQILVRRRFQFSSALKRMSTVSSLPNGRCMVATKGAPETIRRMLSVVPQGYDDTFKWYTRRGSRVLALGYKEMDAMPLDKVRGQAWGQRFWVMGTDLPSTRSTNCRATRSSPTFTSSASWSSIVH